MPFTPRRRWFRFAFSLRTLFAAVTFCGVWLGWNLHVVRERQAVIQEVEQFCGAENAFDRFAFESAEDEPDPMYDSIRVSWLRRLMRDRACFAMRLPSTIGIPLMDRAESAFPEAAIYVIADVTAVESASLLGVVA